MINSAILGVISSQKVNPPSESYYSSVMAYSPQFYLRMNDNEATNLVADEIGPDFLIMNGLDSEDLSASGLLSGSSNKGFLFSNNSAVRSDGDRASFMGSSFTVGVLIEPTNIVQIAAIIMNHSSNNGGFQLSVWPSGSGFTVRVIRSGGGDVLDSGQYAYNTRLVVNVVWDYAGGSDGAARLYINGSEVDSHFANNWPGSQAPLVIAAEFESGTSTPGFRYSGKLDEVWQVPVALTAQQISDLYDLA